MQILFWQNVPSIHQAPLMRALADLCQQRFQTPLTIICEDDIPEHRKNMGWAFPDYGSANVIVQPDHKQRAELLAAHSGPESCHIFSGFDMTPLNNRTLQSALTLPCKTGVYLERPQSFPFIKKLMRQLKYSLYAKRYGQIDMLLPVGTMAAHYYQACGFKKDKIFPFAYFVEQNKVTGSYASENKPFKFLYVGRNIPLKRIDLLVNALEHMSDHDWSCDFVGVCEDAIAQYGLSERVQSQCSFWGIQSNEKAKEIMATCDALILPSRYDGWGAVVGEALLSGCKVIVSSEVGAKDLVEDAPSRGWVFKAQSAQDLCAKMHGVLREGPLKKQDRQAISQWAAGSIAPETGARYFLDCLLFATGDISQKPQIPWLLPQDNIYSKGGA